MALNSERLQEYIANVRDKLQDKTPAELKKLDETLNIDILEHFEFQKQQAEMHARGILTPGAAQIIYMALGESPGSNGGWAKNTDIATKFSITKLMEELLSIKIKAAQSR